MQSSGLCWITVLLCLMTKTDDVCGFYDVIYYPQYLTWNEAETVCESEGGNLLTLRSEDKLNQFHFFTDRSIWSNETITETWIGVHAPITYSVTNYSWVDDCETLHEIASWPNGMPPVVEPKYCVYVIIINKTLTLENEVCNETKKPFMCEKHTNGCYYEIEDGKLGPSPYGPILANTKVNCSKDCQTYVDSSNVPCIGFTYNQEAKMCVYHISNDPYHGDTSFFYMSNREFHIKRCFIRPHVNRSITTEFGTLVGLKFPVGKCNTLPLKCEQSSTVNGTTTAGTATILGTTTPLTTMGYGITASPLSADVTGITDSMSTTTYMMKTSSGSPADDVTTMITTTTVSEQACNVTCTKNMSHAEKIFLLIQGMRIDKRRTSNWLSKLNSAQDDRPSAQGIGYVAVVCLIMFIGSIVMMDVDIFCKSSRKRKRSYAPNFKDSSKSRSKRKHIVRNYDAEETFAGKEDSAFEYL